MVRHQPSIRLRFIWTTSHSVMVVVVVLGPWCCIADVTVLTFYNSDEIQNFQTTPQLGNTAGSPGIFLLCDKDQRHINTYIIYEEGIIMTSLMARVKLSCHHDDSIVQRRRLLLLTMRKSCTDLEAEEDRPVSPPPLQLSSYSPTVSPERNRN